jgi:hypothetical protein
VRSRDAVVIVVLGDHGEAVLYGCSRDQGVCELDHPVDPGGSAIGDEARPAHHHRIADRSRVCSPRERERVGTTGANVRRSSRSSVRFGSAAWCPELLAEVLAREPSGATTVRHDVSDRFAVDGQGDPLAGLNGVDHLACPVSQVSDANLHCATV